jgi:hypothetical protein
VKKYEVDGVCGTEELRRKRLRTQKKEAVF